MSEQNGVRQQLRDHDRQHEQARADIASQWEQLGAVKERLAAHDQEHREFRADMQEIKTTLRWATGALLGLIGTIAAAIIGRV